MIKIENIKIKGLRGIKEEIVLPLNRNSILLFGENGSGKSSVTDALEWFYYDKIEHLSSEEIGRKGLEGLKNIHIGDSEDGEPLHMGDRLWPRKPYIAAAFGAIKRRELEL